MKNIWKNSSLLLIFLIIFLFKDSIYKIYEVKDYSFDFLKENELQYYKNEYMKLLDVNYINDNDYIISKVIYRNIYDFYNEITILKGDDYGINKNSAVVNELGLIGIVKKVNKSSSNVMLLNNKDFKLSVKFSDNYGILESENNDLYIKNVISDALISIGDIVYTSGLTDIDEGIPIGKIKKIDISKDKLSKIIFVQSFADIKNIDYLMIINKVVE